MKSLREITESESTKPLDTSKWKRIGPQMGSNPGGTYRDEAGKDWYVKHSKSDDHAKNEMLAHHLYKALGTPTLDQHLISHNDKLGTASPLTKIKNYNPSSDSDKKEIGKHFAAHAFVSNWDAVGMGEDNQAHTTKGMTTVDVGGSLNYRAQGAPKGAAFGDKVGEWDTLRSPDNPQAHNVFGSMKPHELHHSAKAVANLKNGTIEKLVKNHGPGSDSDKQTMTDKLINRKRDIIGRVNKIAGEHNLKPLADVDD